MSLNRAPFAALALLTLSLVGACKKETAAPPPPLVPTATPVPDKDVLGFVRAGALHVMRYDGGSQRLLAAPRNGQAFWFPVPSPGGDHLIAWLSRGDGTQDIVRVDLSGRVTVLTDIGSKAKPAMKSLRLGNAPAYSPDGKSIAYSFNGDLWMMDANGYNAETFIADGASYSPAFSPDGKRLAYVNGQGRYDAWMVDLDSRDTWQLTEFSDSSVGQPRWNKDGSKLTLNRSQGEDSDVVLVNLAKDAASAKNLELSSPLPDADPITKDRLSAGAVWDPQSLHFLFSSARNGDQVWNIFSSDALGGNAKQLTKEGGLSPFWMRPATGTASISVLDAPSRPTPAVAKPVEVAAAPAAPQVAPTAIPAASAPVAAAPTPKPEAPAATAPGAPATAPSAASPAAAAPASAKPASSPARVAPASAAPAAASPSTAPTQPPAKAAPLRLRLRASFTDDGKLTPAGLAELKKMAPRVAQYASETVNIIGPLDRSGLKGKFPSEESRSKARAQVVVAELVKLAKLKPESAKAQAYSPPAAGSSGPPNSIQIYVELK